jgi:hypothetical protein
VLPLLYRCAAKQWYPSLEEALAIIAARGGE